MKDFLEILRERALRVKLKPTSANGGAIDVPSVSRMLDALNESYLSYLEAEARNAVKGKHTANVEKEIKTLKADAKLLVVDLSFASFEALLSPNSVTTPHRFLSIPGDGDFRKKTFAQYQDEVIFGDPNDPALLKTLEKRFEPDERRAIFSPLFKSVFGQMNGEFHASRANKPLRRLTKTPTEEVLKRLVPVATAQRSEPEPHTVVIYAKAVGDPNLFGERKLKVVKQLAVEALEHDTYPHQFHTIGFGGTRYDLVQTYSAPVRYEEDSQQYHVEFEPLGIHTWGDTRTEAIEAFEFSFVDMVEEYHDAKDSELTTEAKHLKKALRNMINVRIAK